MRTAGAAVSPRKSPEIKLVAAAAVAVMLSRFVPAGSRMQGRPTEAGRFRYRTLR